MWQTERDCIFVSLPSGKRAVDVVDSRLQHQSNFSISAANGVLLDFILAHAQGDERPYLEIYILEHKFMGLLDSGASCTVAGKMGWEILKGLDLPMRSSIINCTVANGQHCTSLGVISAPIRLRNCIKIIDILIVPELPHLLILGTDFWRSMGIVPDLRRGEWTFSSSPSISVDLITARSNLTLSQQKILDTLTEDMCPVNDVLGCANSVEHKIQTDCEPIKQRYYPVSPAVQKHVDRELDSMLSQGIVERSDSPWSSPILLVPKKDGSYRFCVDYRKLNKVTKRDAYPLPSVSQTLDKLRDARFLTSLDIKSAYWQIPVAESSKQLTAFTVPNRGLFQFRRMPFGLHNAPATWQRFIDRVIGLDLEPHVFVYLDDIVIVTNTFEKHIEILNEVLSRLSKAGLTVSREKCHFCRDELRYLGYVVDKRGLHVDPEKIRAILEIPKPSTVSEVRRLLGMASWYRRFVPQFSALISPLTSLLRKKAVFRWDESCDDAWTLIKNHLVSAPILSCPDFNRDFCVQTDASDYGIGAVLTQKYDDGEKVICYLSRSLTRQERKYSTTEKELLALMWSIEKLRPYIEGSHFTAITDHYSLLWLSKLQNPSGRLARWAVRLQQYSFTIIHRKGKEHVVPDALSRSVPVIDMIELDTCKDKWYVKLRKSVSENPDKFPAFRISENKLFKFVDCDDFGLLDENFKWKQVIPKERRSELIRNCHDIPTSGHLGIFKTHNRLSREYYWPKMKADVANYVNRCVICLKSKPEQKAPPGRMGGHSQITKPWEVICTDLVGPLPRTVHGCAYILVVADCFSKFSLFFPLRKANTVNVVKHLENDVFLLFGVPRKVISDNGVQFKSTQYRKLLASYSVKPAYTSYYHPQANPAERVNRVLKTMLISYAYDNHREWDKFLPKVACALRTAAHEVTKLTPYFVNFGREMNLLGNHGKLDTDDNTVVPDDIEVKRDVNKIMERACNFSKLYKDVRMRLQKAYEKSKSRYDLRRRDVQFFPNQLVWRKNFVLSDASKFYTAKLAEKFVGPFRIHKRIATDSYILKSIDGDIMRGTWNVKNLKAHPEDDADNG